MKVEKYYDVGCDFCGRHLSTDFYAGFFTKREWALREAKKNRLPNKAGAEHLPRLLRRKERKQ